MKSGVFSKSQCTDCNNEISLDLAVCPQCNAAQGLEALAGVNPSIKIKNQKLAVWLGFLLGILGLHKFYLGDYFAGSLYLVFSWTLVPMVIGWVDAIRTLKMSSFNFEQRYCRRVTQHYA